MIATIREQSDWTCQAVHKMAQSPGIRASWSTMAAWFGFLRRKSVGAVLVDLAVILLLFLPYFIFLAIPPVERMVWRDDRSIMYPHKKHETIPTWTVPIFAFVIPVIVMTAWLGYKRFANRKMVAVYAGLCLSLLITVQVTTLVKPLAGRPRPDFLARCDPDPEILDRVVCRGLPKLVKEGRKSFPSGHTSASFSGLGYTGFFLAGQLKVFDGKGRVYRMVVSLLPFLIATYVGITRVIDYRHHWQDVIAGAILGTSASYLSYRIHFPPIMEKEADLLLDDNEEDRNSKDGSIQSPNNAAGTSSCLAGPEAV